SEEIPEAIADGQFYDMQSLSSALIGLVLSGDVDREVAASAAPNRHDFLVLLSRAEKARAAEMQAADLAPQPEPEDNQPTVRIPPEPEPLLRMAAADVEAR